MAQVEKQRQERLERQEAQRRANAEAKQIVAKGDNGYYVKTDEDGVLHYYNSKNQEISAEEFKKKCPTIYDQVNGIKTIKRNKYDIKTLRAESKELAKKIYGQISGASTNSKTA